MKVDTLLAAGGWPALPGEARRLEEAGYDATPGLPPDRFRALLAVR